MPGVKGRSGRKKVVSTLVNEALKRVDENLPNIFQALIDRAKNGDREAQIYLIDRRLGKPKQQIDADFKGAVGLMTATEYRVLLEGVAQRKIELERKLLGEADVEGV